MPGLRHLRRDKKRGVFPSCLFILFIFFVGFPYSPRVAIVVKPQRAFKNKDSAGFFF